MVHLGILAHSAEGAALCFFACPDNTAHMALEQPGEELALPGLHIAEVVADQAARDGRTRVGVLGTRYTMEGPVYPRAFASRPIAGRPHRTATGVARWVARPPARMPSTHPAPAARSCSPAWPPSRTSRSSRGIGSSTNRVAS